MSKLFTTFEQDGEKWNPKAFHNITEEEAHKRYFKSSNYKKKTITAVWKISNGLSKPNPKQEGESKD